MPMDDRRLAEAVARELFLGLPIQGVLFGGTLQLLIGWSGPGRGQPYVNLNSRWTVFPKTPARPPDDESELPEWPIGQQLGALYGLREKPIVDVQLGETDPHLMLTLESGAVFFLNGKSARYESWQLGTWPRDGGETWMVVIMPGGTPAIWVPDWFARKVYPPRPGLSWFAARFALEGATSVPGPVTLRPLQESIHARGYVMGQGQLDRERRQFVFAVDLQAAQLEEAEEELRSALPEFSEAATRAGTRLRLTLLSVEAAQ